MTDRVIAATPSHDGRCSLWHRQTMLAAQRSLAIRGVEFDQVIGRSCDLEKLRNTLAAAAVEEGATHVLWLDEDIAILDDDGVGKMHDMMARHELALLSLSVLRRPAFGHESGLAHPSSEPHGPADDHIACASAALSTEGVTRFRVPMAPGLMRPPPGSILLLGAGCLMVRADVHRALGDAFEWGELRSEDWTLCARAQAAGFAAALDTTIPTMHSGMTSWIYRGARSNETRPPQPVWRAYREADALLRAGEKTAAADRLESAAKMLRDA